MTMLGEKNHQYGLVGELNSSYRGGRIKKNGYIQIYQPEHPFNIGNYVREHRLIAEQYLLTDENSIIVDGTRYLNPEYEVHHIDENKTNNKSSNLLVLTKGEHITLHNLINPQGRCDITGRFIKEGD